MEKHSMFEAKKRTILGLSFTNYNVVNPFTDFIKQIPFSNLKDITKKTLVIFEGGTDISSFLYGQPNSFGEKPCPERDYVEAAMFKRAVFVGAPMLGICRGAQFLTAMNGGTVIQHCTGHRGYHSVTVKTGKQICVSSTHHQMMRPFNLPHEEFQLIGWATDNLSKQYLNGYGQNETMSVEPEIVWYPKTRSLAIQGHPEYMQHSKEHPDPFVEYCGQLIEEYLLNV